MTKLRKDKEVEIFREFQRHQQHLGGLLQTQQLQASSDEDQRIAQAMAEQHAKRDVSIITLHSLACEERVVYYTHMYYIQYYMYRLKKWQRNKSLLRLLEIFTNTCWSK